MSLARRIASSTISQIIAKFFVAGLSVVSVKLVTNYLGTAGYGEYTVVYELMAFALIMADFGFFHIALREMGKNREKMAKILGNIMSLRLLISLIAISLTSGFVFFATDYSLETVKFGLMIASANVVFGLMGTTITAILQVHLKMTYAAFVQIIGKICMVSYIAYAAFNDLGFLHTLWAGLFGSLVILLMTFFYTRRYTKIYFGFDFKLWKELFRETLPMGIALICYNIYLRSPIIILDRITRDSSLTGIYGVAQRIIEILMFMPIAFMNSTLPTLSDLLHNPKNINAKEKINKIIQASFDSLVAIAFPVMIGGMIIARQLVTFISGEEFLLSAKVLQYLIFIIIFYFLSTLFTYILIALNQQKKVMLANGIAAITSVIASFILIPMFGIFGAIGGHIIPEAVAMILTYYFAKKIYPFKLKFINLYKIFISSLLMGGIILLFPDLHMFFKIPLAAILYTLALIIFRVVPTKKIIKSFYTQIKSHPDFIETKDTKKIAVDFRSIYGDKTGKEWYTFSLLKALGEIDSKNHYILYTKYDFDDKDLPINFTKRILHFPVVFWHLHVLLDMVVNRVDIVFATSSYIIASLSRFSRRFKLILVVHDLVAFLFPASKHSLKATIIERLTSRLAFSRADKIIVPSQNTSNDLTREFPKTKDKIVLIPEAARTSFYPITDNEQIKKVLKKYNLPKDYMIFIGTLEPRKNLVKLFEAYAKIDKEIRNKYPLVIVGKKGWYYERIFKAVRKNRIKKDVIFVGYVPDSDLPTLLSNAKLSIYPSKYEGFGLPLLEAMQCKTPIVSSNTPALLEVAKGACEIANRKDTDSIKQAILNVITDKNRQKNLIEKGFERSKKYSWQKTAREVVFLF